MQQAQKLKPNTDHQAGDHPVAGVPTLKHARAELEDHRIKHAQVNAPSSHVVGVNEAGTTDYIGARYAYPSKEREFWQLKQAIKELPPDEGLVGTWNNTDHDVRMIEEEMDAAHVAEYDRFVLSQIDVHQPGHLDYLRRVAPGVLERRYETLNDKLEALKSWTMVKQTGVQTEHDLKLLFELSRGGAPPQFGLAGSNDPFYLPGFFASPVIYDQQRSIFGWPLGDAMTGILDLQTDSEGLETLPRLPATRAAVLRRRGQ